MTLPLPPPPSPAAKASLCQDNEPMLRAVVDRSLTGLLAAILKALAPAAAAKPSPSTADAADASSSSDTVAAAAAAGSTGTRQHHASSVAGFSFGHHAASLRKAGARRLSNPFTSTQGEGSAGGWRVQQEISRIKVQGREGRAGRGREGQGREAARPTVLLPPTDVIIS